MKLVQLSNSIDLVSEIAELYFQEWGHFNPRLNQSDIEASLQRYLQSNEIPQAVVALEGENLMGVAQVKIRELSLYSQHEHWLGGVFVKPEFRGKSVGLTLIQQAVELAHTYDIEALYLQTLRLDGGLYRKIGWKPVEVFQHDGHTKLLMVNQLKNE